jgi:hypothetical protein
VFEPAERSVRLVRLAAGDERVAGALLGALEAFARANELLRVEELAGGSATELGEASLLSWAEGLAPR